jgi:hypothetical protein
MRILTRYQHTENSRRSLFAITWYTVYKYSRAALSVPLLHVQIFKEASPDYQHALRIASGKDIMHMQCHLARRLESKPCPTGGTIDWFADLHICSSSGESAFMHSC